MRLIDRFLLREFALPFGVCLGGFLVFWVGFDLLGNMADYRDKRMRPGDVAAFYWVSMPEQLTTVLPVALMLALLYAITRHARHQELTAIRAAGIGWWRLCLPYFMVGLTATGLLYLLNEVWFHDAADQADRIKQRRIESDTARAWRTRVGFRNEGAVRSWHLGAFNVLNGELRHASFRDFLPTNSIRLIRAERVRWTNGFWRADRFSESILRTGDDPNPATLTRGWSRLPEFPESPGSLTALTNATPAVPVETNRLAFTNITRGIWKAASVFPAELELLGLELRIPVGGRAERIVQAEAAAWTPDGWWFTNVTESLQRFAGDDDPLLTTASVRQYPELEESPAQIRSELKVTGRNTQKLIRRARLSMREIEDYRRLHPELSDRDRQFLLTQWHARAAAPWTCLVVTLITIPFGAPSGRRNLFYGVAGSIALAFTYFVLQRIGFALAQGGATSGLLGAWLPNATFAGAGLTLLARLR